MLEGLAAVQDTSTASQPCGNWFESRILLQRRNLLSAGCGPWLLREALDEDGG
jgi:hypothetical protein